MVAIKQFEGDVILLILEFSTPPSKARTLINDGEASSGHTTITKNIGFEGSC